MKIKLFYGWYIVIAGLVLAAYYSSIFSYGWSGFVNPIVTTFGWSMTQVSLASSLRSLEVGVFNPLWGTAVDRFSSRKLMLLGVIVMTTGMLVLSQTRNLAMFYGGFLIVGLSSSLITSILPIAVISRWFKRDMGKASGLLYVGIGLGGAAVTLLVGVIDKYGWQRTLLYAAIGFFILGIPLSFVFRTRPEEYGLVSDGKAQDGKAEPRRHRKGSDFDISVREAVATRAFWTIGFVHFCHAVATSTLNLYIIPYLTGLGISRTTAGTVVSLYTLVSVFTRMPMGYLSDLFRTKNVIAMSVGLQGAGLILFWLITGTSPSWLIPLFGVVYGLGLGGASPLRAAVVAEYFGTKKFGTIFGLSSVFMTVGSVAFPPLVGWVYDTYHDYRTWWMVVIIANLLSIIAILTIPAAKKSVEAHAN